jgi:enamine deaminase RidA (YjgF/YER057c/UK114 family)
MDLMALVRDDGRSHTMMRARTMNEAPSYGADFSRGARLPLDGPTLLVISGTASIDRNGCVAHVGDIRGQARCMLDNVADLLAQQGTEPSSMVQAVTYIKRREDLEHLRAALLEKGFPPDIPHTICIADVCRPAWLCEMEGLAVISLTPAASRPGRGG